MGKIMLKTVVLGVLSLAGVAAAGDVTIETQMPGSRLRPGSFGNPYVLRQDGRELGRLEEQMPGGRGRQLRPGEYLDPWVLRPGRDAESDGFDGFGAFDGDRE